MALTTLSTIPLVLNLASEHLYEVTGAMRFIELIFDKPIPRGPTRTC